MTDLLFGSSPNRLSVKTNTTTMIFSKCFSPLLKNENVVLVGVGYRLTPKAKFPDFLEDAAAAVAWTVANINHYGGNAAKSSLEDTVL